MPLLNSRIEKELIFSSFTVTKPELCIKSGNICCRISYDDYLSEMNCITLLKDEHLVPGTIAIISFFYKKAKIFFKTIIERENAIFFRIPQDIHVARKKRKKLNFPSMKLYYQNFLLSTFSPSITGTQIKKKYGLNKGDTADVKDIFIKSKSMGHDLFYLLQQMKQCIPLGKDLYSHLHIIDSFLKEKKIKDTKKRNMYVFSDSHIILLFATRSFALQFASDKLKKFKADIAFKDRNITCEVQYSFFSPFEQKESLHSFGFLGFKIIDIQEEDKRYLYEGVFSNRYGESLCMN